MPGGRDSTLVSSHVDEPNTSPSAQPTSACSCAKSPRPTTQPLAAHEQDWHRICRFTGKRHPSHSTGPGPGRSQPKQMEGFLNAPTSGTSQNPQVRALQQPHDRRDKAPATGRTTL